MYDLVTSCSFIPVAFISIVLKVLKKIYIVWLAYNTYGT